MVLLYSMWWISRRLNELNQHEKVKRVIKSELRSRGFTAFPESRLEQVW